MDLSPFFAAVKSAIESRFKSQGLSKPQEVDLAQAFDQIAPIIAPLFDLTLDDNLRANGLRAMQARIAVNMETGTALVDRRSAHKEWVREKNFAWDCWESYEGSLYENGLPEGVVLAIGHDTFRVLDLLGDPSLHSDWDRRGLVLGHVQSGKTSNYSGLLCRAADAGYKLFIIIAGIHENLRSQTQDRINAAFVDLAPPAKRPISLTTKDGDFARNLAEQRIPHQAVGTSLVLVVKKNAKILENLQNWLRDNSRPGSDWADMPLLLIDDEADNASVNTNNADQDPTRINGLIRSILSIFRKSSYVGYTATPFANIFIDPTRSDEMVGQELFPRDFIYCLEAPDNYFGADRVFMREDETAESLFLRDIPTDEDDLLPRSHRSSFSPSQLPASLVEAIRLFLLACAVRNCQGAANKHISMLVNVSPYARVQRSIGLLTNQNLEETRRRVLASACMPGMDQNYWAELEALYQMEFGNSEVPWPTVRRALPEAIRTVRVVVINSGSQDRLDYKAYDATGLKVIAVGGYTLSRGLTLENLTISYWKRNSKAYDTLLQMGRWFGYRDEYESLCRIWMPLEAQGWYEHIAEASLELRDDLIDMSRRGFTPEDFGLKVRNHPETLIVTARNKMRAAEPRTVRPDLGCRLLETHVVCNDAKTLSDNLSATERLLIRIQETGDGILPQEDGVHRLWRQIPHEWVSTFFHEYKAHRRLLHADNDYLMAWLRALQEALERRGEQLAWDVLLVSLNQPQSPRFPLAGIEIGLQDRTVGGKVLRGRVTTWDQSTDDLMDGWRISSKQRVASRGVEKYPLSSEQRHRAETESQRKNKNNVPDLEYRKLLSRPLLMLHVIDLKYPKEHNPDEAPQSSLHRGLAAWGASFPQYGDLRIQAREYTVNRVWLEQFELSRADDEGED